MLRSCDGQRAIYRSVCRHWRHVIGDSVNVKNISWTRLACMDPYGTPQFLAFIEERTRRNPWNFLGEKPRKGHRESFPSLDMSDVTFNTSDAATYLAAAGRTDELMRAIDDRGWEMDVREVVHAASAFDHVAILDMLTARGHRVPLMDAIESAAQRGNSKILAWCFAPNVCSIPHSVFAHAVYIHAVVNGQLDTIKWMYARHPFTPPDHHRIAWRACRSGNVALLKWLVAVGVSMRHFDAIEFVSQGHIDALEWYTSVGGKVRVDDPVVLLGAVKSGNVAMVKWLQQRYVMLTWPGAATEHAALNRDMRMLETLYTFGCPITYYALCVAAADGNLPMFEWLVSRRPLTPEAGCCEAALENRQFHILRFIHAMCFPCMCSDDFKNATLGVHPNMNE